MISSSTKNKKINISPRLTKQLFLYLIAASLIACAGERPDNLGIVLGKLTPCPATPNCVSTASTKEQQKIAALEASISAIKLVLLNMDNVNIVVDKTDYIHAEFTSTLGFVDDVEFYAPDQQQLTLVRSASRLGKNDMGANRKHIEEIRKSLNQQ